MAESDIHTVGTKIWIKDDKEAWQKAEVVKVEDGGKLTVRTEAGAEVQCDAKATHLQNPESRGVEVSRWTRIIMHAT